MTVRELIEKLSAMPPEAQVYVEDWGEECRPALGGDWEVGYMHSVWRGGGEYVPGVVLAGYPEDNELEVR